MFNLINIQENTCESKMMFSVYKFAKIFLNHHTQW